MKEVVGRADKCSIDGAATKVASHGYRTGTAENDGEGETTVP